MSGAINADPPDARRAPVRADAQPRALRDPPLRLERGDGARGARGAHRRPTAAASRRTLRSASAARRSVGRARRVRRRALPPRTAPTLLPRAARRRVAEEGERDARRLLRDIERQKGETQRSNRRLAKSVASWVQTAMAGGGGVEQLESGVAEREVEEEEDSAAGGGACPGLFTKAFGCRRRDAGRAAQLVGFHSRASMREVVGAAGALSRCDARVEGSTHIGARHVGAMDALDPREQVALLKESRRRR